MSQEAATAVQPFPFQDCAILFGDSITNRQDVPSTIQALMSEHYRRTLDVVNRGFGGYNTTFARQLFDNIFVKKELAKYVPKVRLVTIWFGTNDAVLPDNEMGQHVSLSDFRANLTYFLESLTSSSSPYAVAHSPISVVLISPAPMYKPLLPPVLSQKREPAVTKQYVDVVNELVAEWRAKGEKEGGSWRVEGVDMWRAILDEAAGNDEKMKGFFTDGLHLSTAGYAVFWKEYTKLVRGPLKGRGLDWDDLEDCPPRAPLWDDLDHTRPESVIEGLKHASFRNA